MSLSHLKTSLEANISNGHIVLLDYTQATVAFTTGEVDTTSDEIDLTGSFTPAAVVGTRLYFTGLSATTDLENNTTYYVVAVAGTEVQISAEPGGTEIDLTVAVSGTVSECAPVQTGLDYYSESETVADLVRHEVANYQSINSGDRPTFTDPGTATYVNPRESDGTVDTSRFGVQLQATVDLDTSTPVDYTHYALITGGSATPGNTTGTVILTRANSSTATVGSTLTVYQGYVKEP